MAVKEGSFTPDVEESFFAHPGTPGLTFRDVTPDDAPVVGEFLVKYGRTDINPLPDPFVGKHVAGIAAGEVGGVLAEIGGEPIGVFTYEVQRGEPYGKYQPAGQESEPYGYLAEAVARPGFVTRLGTMLTETALHKVGKLGVKVAYSIHHTDNNASGGMMLNNGMTEVAVLDQRATRGRQMAIKQKILNAA